MPTNQKHTIVISRLENHLNWVRLKYILACILLFGIAIYGGSMIIMIPIELWRTGSLSSHLSAIEYIVAVVALISCYPVYRATKKLLGEMLSVEERIKNLALDKKTKQ